MIRLLPQIWWHSASFVESQRQRLRLIAEAAAHERVRAEVHDAVSQPPILN